MNIGSIKSQEVIYIAGRPESLWQVALRDIVTGLADYRLWMFLGWQDIKQQYRRSVIGPFWLTISTGIMISLMTVLYGRLFKMDMDVYGPFLASGTIIWSLIAALVNGSCNSFMAVSELIKQVRMPLTLHICRMVWRNMVIFLHNAVILIPVWIFFHRSVNFSDLFLVLLGLLILSINAVFLSMMLGALCTRFRDISTIVSNLVQVVFFVTPVMWMPAILEGKGVAWWLINLNPFFHFIEIVRAPLLGTSISLNSWIAVSLVTLLVAVAGIFMLGRFRTRIPYWL